MAWIDDRLSEYVQSPAVAGAVGSLISLRWMPGTSWASKFVSLLVGCSVAIFLAPYLVEVVGVTSKSGAAAFAFLSGFLGLMAMGKGWDWISTTTFGELVSSIFTKRPT